MSQFAVAGARPARVQLFSSLLLIGAVFMGLLGWSAGAYYVPALCLALLSVLLWSGRAGGLVKWVLVVNQAAGLVLVLALWLGDGLGEHKLDVSGVALLVNLLCGGPLASLLGAAMLPGLRSGGRLSGWFNARSA